MKRLAAWMTIAALGLGAAPASAQSDADRKMARELGQQGADALDARRYDRALELFRKADQLYHAPTLTLGLARAYAGTGKLVSALEAYERLDREGAGVRPPPAFVTAVEQGRRESRAIAARIGRLVVEVVPTVAGVSITIDGDPMPAAAIGLERPIDPGSHKVAATAPGYAPREVSIDVREGATRSVRLELDRLEGAAPVDPAAPAPGPVQSSSAGRRTAGYVLLGVGGAGLAAGAILGGLAVAKKSDLSAACGADKVCPPGESGTVSAFKAFGTGSTAALVSGAVLAGGGLVLVLTAPRASASASSSTHLVVGPSSLHLAGTF